MQETLVQSLSWEDPLEKGMATHSSILPEEFHGQRSLVGYSSRGHKESDMTERLTLSLYISILPSSPLWWKNTSSLDPIGKNPSPDSLVLFAPKEWERMYVYCSSGGEVGTFILCPVKEWGRRESFHAVLWLQEQGTTPLWICEKRTQDFSITWLIYPMNCSLSANLIFTAIPWSSGV